LSRRVSRLLLTFIAAAGGMIPSPSAAQGQMESVLQLGGRRLSLAAAEMEALSNLRRTVSGRRGAIQDAALAAARRVARSPDALHLLAVYQLEIAQQRNDNDLRAPALDVLIASNLTQPDRLAGYLAVRGQIAFERRDFETAGSLWARRLAMQPNDPQAIANLAQVHHAQGNLSGAAEMLARAAAVGGAVSENLYRQWMSVAQQGGLVEPGIAAARFLVATFSTARNWRDAMVVYRHLAAPTNSLEIDHLRLMRLVGVLARPAEYQRMAQLLMHAGMAAEAKAVLDEGLSRAIIRAAESPTREIIVEVERAVPRQRSQFEALQATQTPTAEQVRSMADSLLGLGRYAEAATRYRTALERAAGPAAELNTRLGIALVLAGRRADAEAAFRLAAGTASIGQAASYGNLAQFWLAWLAHRPGSAGRTPS
jgi:tetratricopeptide (TPR) repeat protein